MTNRWSFLTRLVALAMVATLLPAVASSPTAAQAQSVDLTIPGGVTITVGDLGPDVTDVVLTAGQTLTIRNESSAPIATDLGGVVTSGQIAPGGAHVVAPTQAAVLPWSIDGARVGDVVVGSPIDGADADLLVDVLPDTGFAPLTQVVPHPTLIVPAAADRVLARFADSATVADARDLFTRYDVVLLGALQPGAIVHLGVADPGDFSVIDPLVTGLRQEPALAAATLVRPATTDELPDGMSQSFSDAAGWRWDEPEAPGTRANWWHETIRTPQAWNLLEALSGTARTISVIDNGFNEAHPSLAQQSDVRTYCDPDTVVGQPCNVDITRNPDGTPNDASHGTVDAAIAGGAWDGVEVANGQWGFRGVDPQADLALVPWAGRYSQLELFKLRIDEIAAAAAVSTDDVDLEVLSYSAGELSGGSAGRRFAAAWVAKHGSRGFVCGPGPDDDGQGSLPCLPSTEDGWLTSKIEGAEAIRPLFERASDVGVLIVTSAGNGGGLLCDAGGSLATTFVEQPDGSLARRPGCTPFVDDTDANGDIEMLGARWSLDAASATRTNPIVRVEATGTTAGTTRATTDLADFSLTGGEIAAPGFVYGPCTEPNSYCGKAGTSQATPMVAGVASLIAAHPSTTTIGEVRETLLSSARPITTARPGGSVRPDGSAPTVPPTLDAYAALASLPGSHVMLADLNDDSIDGNRRVDLTGDAPVEDREFVAGDPLARTAPDGRVDMRDFRRLRDALLQACASSGDCPSLDVKLDGAPTNPHFDLNGDGCVAGTTGAPGWCEPEHLFARADLNGDGSLSITESAPVPTEDEGAVELTDLEVLARAWTAGPGAGWGPADLVGLVESGDVSVSVGGAITPDATSAVVVARDGSGEVTRVPVDPSADSVVVTLPADSLVELRLDAIVDGATRTIATSDPLSVGVGEDRFVELCPPLRVDAVPARVRPGEATTIVVAVSCSTVDPVGADVSLDLTPTGGDVPVLSERTGVLDEFGSFSTTLTAGDSTGRFTVDVEAILDPTGAAVSVSGSTDVLVTQTHTLEVVDLGPRNTLAPTPVIADDGRVAWFRATGTSASILTALPGATPSSVPGSSAPLSPTNGQAWIAGGLGIDDVGGLVALRTSIDNSGSSFRQETELLSIDRATGTEFELLRSVLDIGTTPTATYADVGLPDVAPDGSVVLGAREQGGVGPSPLVRPDVTGVAVGPAIASVVNDDPGATRPDRAADGTTAIVGTTSLGTDDRGLPIFDEEVLVGPDVLGDATTLVGQSVARASDGWATDPDPAIGTSTLGRQVGISDTGRVLVFVGDRGDGPGLYAAVRNDAGAWTAPVPLAGAPGSSPLDEFGSEDGVVRYLADIAADADVDVVHQPDVDGGLTGTAVAVLEGTPNLADPATGLSAEPGLFVVTFTVDATGLLPGDVTPLVQVGDPTVDGPVAAFETHEAIAAGPTGEPGDHRVVWWERTETGTERIIRATAVLDGSTSTTPAAAGTSSLRLAAAGPTSSAARSLPATTTSTTTVTAAAPIAALTVQDLTPAVGDAVAVANRSVDASGTAIAADLDLAGATESVAAAGVVTWTPASAGAATLRVTAGHGAVVSASVDATVLDPGPTNQPPVVDGGGPYTLQTGTGLLLDASGSSDPDGDPLTFAWDLDRDGSYGERLGAVLTLSYVEIEAFVCGGECTVAGPVTVGLRVEDGRGGVTDADVTIDVDVVTEDFSVSVQPPSQPINAGDTVEYVVSVGAVGAFDDVVSLAVDALPAGWTATLGGTTSSTRTVRPPTTTTLQVTPPSDAATGLVETIGVTGTSGDLVRSSSADTEVVFGLIPRCTGAIGGVLTDAYTGLPIPGAAVQVLPPIFGEPTRSTTTSPDGSWLLTGLPAYVTSPTEVRIGADGYWGSLTFRRMLCDTTVDGDAELVPELTGAIAGRAVEGIRGPDGTITPIGDGLAGVKVRGISTSGGVATTAADGSFRLDDLQLNLDNRPRTYDLNASLDGFWRLQASPQVRPLETAGVTFTMVRQCTANVRADVTVVDQNGDLVEGSNVSLDDGVTRGTTGPDGRVTLPATDLLLGPLNAPRGVPIEAFPPSGAPVGSSKGTAFVQLDDCGQVTDVDVVIEVFIQAPLVEYVADVAGTVTDVDTGLRVAGAEVISVNTRGFTDAEGRYLLQGVSLGFSRDPAPYEREISVVVRADDYLVESLRTVAVSDTLNVVDLAIDREEFGVVLGTVTDADTGEPVSDVAITTSPRCQGAPDVTASDGTYLVDDLPLDRNEPRQYTFCAYRDRTDTQAGYYAEQTSVTVSPDPTVVDFELVRICDGATIRGTVVNADTGDPLEDVRVLAGGVVTRSAADGSFVLSRIEPGPDNTPRQVEVVASKDGFFTLRRDVTVFCGAQLFVPFGEGSTEVGTITGTVTDGTGAPVAGAFVGAEYGGSTTTAADGTYELADAPLGADGGARTWTVTAIEGDLRGSADATVSATTPGVADIVLAEPDPNRAPVAGDIDPPNIDEDSGPYPIPLPASDPDGDPLSLTITRPPSLGTLELDGLTATYTPDPDAFGIEEFSYVVEDPSGLVSNEGLVGPFVVVPVDDPPVLDPIADQTIDAGFAVPPLEVPISATDIDDTRLSFSAAPDPFVVGLNVFVNDADTSDTEATLVLFGEDTLPAGDYGVRVTVSDGTSQDSTLVTVTVRSDVALPVADDIDVTTPQDTNVEITLTSDLDPAVATYALVDRPDASQGFVALSRLDAVVFDPDPLFVGASTFTYVAIDNSRFPALASEPATVTVTVTGVDTPPTADDIDLTTDEDVPVAVTLDGNDPDGDPLAYRILTAPTSGTLTGTAPNLVYVPDPDTNGTDTFTYVVDAGGATSATATATITVAPVDDPPTLQPIDDGTVTAGTTTGVDLTVTDIDGGPADLTGTLPAWATLTDTDGSDGTGTVTLAPTSADVGTTTLTVEVSNGTDPASQQSFDVTVLATDAPPTADDVDVTTDEDVPVAVTLDGNDPDGDPLAYRILTAPTSGTLTGTAPNLVYVPDPDTNGTDTFTYVVDAGGATSATATATITVAPVDDPPTLQPIDDVELPTRTTLVVDVGTNDIDGGPVTIAGVGLPDWAVLVDDLDGTASITLSPGDDEIGTTTLMVEAGNGTDPASQQSFDVAVTAPPAPVADVGGPVEVETGDTVELDASASTGADLTFGWTASGGSLDPTDLVVVTYTAGDVTGDYLATVTVTDRLGRTDTATVPITVTEPPPPPTGTPGRITGGGWVGDGPGAGSEGTNFGFQVRSDGRTVRGTLTAVVRDVGVRLVADGFDALTVSDGTATFSGTGSVDGVPGHRFTVTVTDPVRGRGGDTFSLTVTAPDGSVVVEPLADPDVVSGQVTIHRPKSARGKR